MVTAASTDIKITDLPVSGDGAPRHSALQLSAVIFGLPVARRATAATSTLGVAIALGVGLKLHSDCKSTVKEMARFGLVFEPDK